MIKLIKSTFYKEPLVKRKLCSFIQKSSQLSFGNECETFESQFAAWQGRKDCVMVNSGSSANLAAIQALLNVGLLKKGDKVGFSAITWSTNVMPLIELGLQPVPIDVELDTLNVSSKRLIERLKKHTLRALFLTNLLGFCDDVDEIVRVCKKNNIILIEDNCESMGTVYQKKKLGNFGLLSTFSFYVGHHMSTIEGGAVCTNDNALATMLRLVRAHGWDRNLSYTKQDTMRKKFKVGSTFYSRYTFYDLGYNLRPTEINGYVGQIQLQFIDEIIAKRKKNYFYIMDAINDSNKYFSIRSSHIDLLSNFAVPIICKSENDRDALVKKCDKKLEIRPIVGGDMTTQPFSRKYATGTLEKCPNAKLIHNQGLYFGNNPELTKKEMDIIIDLFVS